MGYREFLLQKLYVQILADASDEAFVRDPVSLVPPGEARATTVYLCELDVAVDFIVVFRKGPVFPKYMQVWLEAPEEARRLLKRLEVLLERCCKVGAG